MSNQPHTQPMRERLTKLFGFLKAYTDLRFPPVRDIAQQPRSFWLKDLPSHPSVEMFRDVGKSEEESEDSGIVLRLTRPVITQCPPPPPVLAEWLKPGWQELSGAVEIQPTRNVAGRDGRAVIERFDADSRRPSLLRNWRQGREQWVTNERPARRSLMLFQIVYEWYGVQEREGERIELLVGDGLLQCAPEIGEKFRHPILFQKLELEFYPEKRQPQFVFRKREQQPELYMEFLRVLPAVNAQQLARCADELKKAEFAPLGGDDTGGFLRRLIQGLFPGTGTIIDDRHDSLPAPDMSLVNQPPDESRPVI